MGCDVSRMGLRVIFSAIISERAIFEVSLEKIKAIIDERYPENATFTQILYEMAMKKISIDKENLKALLEGFSGESTLSKNFG